MIASIGPTGGTSVWVAVAACVVTLLPAGARWLRVAQREHYLADATSRFATRWWGSEPANLALVLLSLAGVALSVLWPLAALAPAGAAVIGPLHLSLRGRTSRLAFTRRLKTLAAVWVILQAAVIGIGIGVGAPALLAAAGVVVAPSVVDLACLVTAPFERRLAGRFVRTASERLKRVNPRVVAITGSFGKTSTKNHVAHLVAGSLAVVATPASFNNRAGLARSINEHLVDGTDVFVAEMGTYGRGEIRELCSWCPPEIAVITAIGPVHLERFGTLDAIVTAKSEITERASVAIFNVNEPRLDALASRLAAEGNGLAVVRCSATTPQAADVGVSIDNGTAAVWVDGVQVADDVVVRDGVQATNIACALAVALRLGVPVADAIARISSLPSVPNRLVGERAASGVYVIDDTFNSNPAGAHAALAMLAVAPVVGRRAVVTPGMIELGWTQAMENEAFARDAGDVATDLVVVGRTNRRALRRGAVHPPVVVGTRNDAVSWVRANLGPGDAVLYENDLPDQFP